jgi:hypothetical protein
MYIGHGRTLDLPSVIELAPCKYKRVYFYFGRMIRSKEKENFKQAGRKTATG